MEVNICKSDPTITFQDIYSCLNEDILQRTFSSEDIVYKLISGILKKSFRMLKKNSSLLKSSCVSP